MYLITRRILSTSVMEIIAIANSEDNSYTYLKHYFLSRDAIQVLMDNYSVQVNDWIYQIEYFPLIDNEFIDKAIFN